MVWQASYWNGFNVVLKVIMMIFICGMFKWILTTFAYCVFQLLSETRGERGHCFPVLSKGSQRGRSYLFNTVSWGISWLTRSTWNKFIAAIHAPTTFRMVFYALCYHFWGQHCCWTETSHWWRIFCFCKFAFFSILLLTPALPLLRLLPVFCVISPINWTSSQTWLSKFRSQNC